MLTVLAELEKLADQLDAKRQHKLADEVEGIMAAITSKASVKKVAFDFDTIPELQETGDPYTYGYDADNDSFVVTSPRGKGTVIEQGGRYHTSWQALQGRLPESLRLIEDPSASGPIDDSEAVGHEQTALAEATKIRDNIVAGKYSDALKENMLRGNRMNKYYAANATLDGKIESFIRDLEVVIADPAIAESLPLDSRIYSDIGRVKIELKMAERLRGGTSPHSDRARASKSRSDLMKEASANLAASMEAAFHIPGRTPFGR
jgi:hypothetical protein